MKNRVILVLQALFTLALLIWIFSNPEVRGQTTEVLRSAKPGWLLAGVAIAGIDNIIGAIRWSIFLGLLGIREKFWTILRLQLLGVLFNTFLIGMVGGDAVKVLVLIGRGHPKQSAILSVILDRMSGFGGLLLVSAVFISWKYEWLIQSPIIAGTLPFLFGYFAVVLLVGAASFVAALSGFSARAPLWIPFREKVSSLCRSYFLFIAQWRKTLIACGISALLLLAYFLIFYCSMRAYGVRIGVTDVFAFMPVVDVISALPISLGGMGVREKLFVVLLGDLADVPAATAVWISISGFLIYLFWGVVGLLALPFFRNFLNLGKKETAEVSTGEK